MRDLIVWFLVGLVGAFTALLAGLGLLALWFAVAGSWATVQYDDGYRRR